MRASLLIALLACSIEARAHAPVEGTGEFVAGALHPILVPAHVAAIVGAGLLAGQGGPRSVELAMGAFTIAIAVGLTSAGFGFVADTGPALLAGAAVLGVLVAAAARLGPRVRAALAGACGLAVGLGSEPLAAAASARLAASLGTGVGASFALLYVAALADWAVRPWQRVGVRIFGSWTAAIALLVLALGVVAGRLEVPAGWSAERAPVTLRGER